MPKFLDADALRDGFAATGWAAVQVVEHTGSTNADLSAAAREGLAAGTVRLTADQQAGRGRFDRVWVTPPDTCLATSVYVVPRRPLSEWGWLSLLVGVAVADGVRESTGLDAELKWPNDVLISGRKVCGILSEAVPGDGQPGAVLGWGLNIALTPDQLPVDTATSLLIEGSTVPAATVELAVLESLHRWYVRWDSGEDVTDAYAEHCSTVGRRVRVHQRGNDVIGLACGIASDGGLEVSTDAGVETFAAGDVVHLRPGD